MNVSGNNNPSPTVREDALAIKTQMEVFATPRNGTVKIMANMSHLWEEIYNNGIVNENPRILIVWTGEIARGEYAGGDRTKLHRVDRQWNVVIMRGHGFKNLVAESVGQPGTPGYYEDFYDSVETVRDGLRLLSNVTADDLVDYKSIRPLPNIAQSQTANVFLDGYVIEFATSADIMAVDVNGTNG